LQAGPDADRLIVRRLMYSLALTMSVPPADRRAIVTYDLGAPATALIDFMAVL